MGFEIVNCRGVGRYVGWEMTTFNLERGKIFPCYRALACNSCLGYMKYNEKSLHLIFSFFFQKTIESLICLFQKLN